MSYKERTLKIFANCEMASTSTTNVGEENPNTRIMPKTLTKSKTEDEKRHEADLDQVQSNADSIMTECFEDSPGIAKLKFKF